MRCCHTSRFHLRPEVRPVSQFADHGRRVAAVEAAQSAAPQNTERDGEDVGVEVGRQRLLADLSSVREGGLALTFTSSMGHVNVLVSATRVGFSPWLEPIMIALLPISPLWAVLFSNAPLQRPSPTLHSKAPLHTLLPHPSLHAAQLTQQEYHSLHQRDRSAPMSDQTSLQEEPARS